MDLSYIAQSENCSLLLDGDGICRWIVPHDSDERARTLAERCIGAQFVAALDPSVNGLLGHEPRVGSSLLFAAVTNGRVALVRFGPIRRFEIVDPGKEVPSSISSTTPGWLLGAPIENAFDDDDAPVPPAPESDPSERLDSLIAATLSQPDLIKSLAALEDQLPAAPPAPAPSEINLNTGSFTRVSTFDLMASALPEPKGVVSGMFAAPITSAVLEGDTVDTGLLSAVPESVAEKLLEAESKKPSLKPKIRRTGEISDDLLIRAISSIVEEVQQAHADADEDTLRFRRN